MNKRKILERLINEHLLDYINAVNTSDRNKFIVKQYVSGDMKDSEIGRYHGITGSRVRQIVISFLLKANRLKRAETEDD